MPIEIIIPRLGWSMDEGNFLGWLRKEGDKIKPGEPLFTLENEKAAQDVEATDGGILRFAKDGPRTGDVVKVGQVIGHLLAEGELSETEAEAATKPPAQPTRVAPSQPGPAAGPGSPALLSSHEPASTDIPLNRSLSPSEGERVPFRAGEGRFMVPMQVAANVEASQDRPVPMADQPRISPRARRRASELGIDMAGLRGSGTSGRVTEADVLKRAKAVPSSGISTMRRTIAQRTAASFSTTPHFYLRCEADATELLRLREDLLPEVESETGIRLTLTDLILRAQAIALRDFPAANAIWAEDKIVSLPSCDVGLVVGLPGGLMIPIVRSPEKGKLADVAKQRATLVESARAGKLTPEAFEGGATSLSNLGNTRVDEFAAVISPSQSSMLAVGRASPRPYAVKGKLAVRATLRLCLSVDHRVMDGGPAAEFLGRIIQLLENPSTLIR
jgi:pyruvate dehydrogenase E2 component (dihydrolipoamide acetyltransferase)